MTRGAPGLYVFAYGQRIGAHRHPARTTLREQTVRAASGVVARMARNSAYGHNECVAADLPAGFGYLTVGVSPDGSSIDISLRAARAPRGVPDS